jgi:hypothetical protein
MPRNLLARSLALFDHLLRLLCKLGVDLTLLLVGLLFSPELVLVLAFSLNLSQQLIVLESEAVRRLFMLQVNRGFDLSFLAT